MARSNQNSRKSKRAYLNKPKTSILKKKQKIKSNHVKFTSNEKNKIKKAMPHSETSATSVSSNSGAIKNWLFGRSMYLRKSEQRKENRENLTIPCAGEHYIRRYKKKFIDKIINKRNVFEEMFTKFTENNQKAKREILFDALRYGESQGILERLDYGPGEYCWIFTHGQPYLKNISPYIQNNATISCPGVPNFSKECQQHFRCLTRMYSSISIHSRDPVQSISNISPPPQQNNENETTIDNKQNKEKN